MAVPIYHVEESGLDDDGGSDSDLARSGDL